MADTTLSSAIFNELKRRALIPLLLVFIFLLGFVREFCRVVVDDLSCNKRALVFRVLV